ncbi:hypothetical protein E0Z10_g4244 [Xylaria hypoxylon]|uniref:Uncharacterized protein n=1 Tax=Xylaria hypoxylon TaxID=37992 RepID=A0A4Z0Z7M7_9PEZI|nr:hypothetical protein E0Z10_g4244 [Xylaria hypoxylon]
MAALTPPNPHTIARLVMEFTTSTGACVIDMPVVRPACSSVFEIVVIEKEVKPDSICITPTASTPLLADPNPPSNRRPGQSSAWWTSSWPLDPGAGGQGGRKTLPKPGDPAKSDPPPDPPSIQIPVKEEPVVLWPPPVRPAPIRSSVPIRPSPSSSSEPGDTVEATPSPTPVSVKEKPSTPAPSPSRLQSSSTSSRPAGPPGKGGPTSTSTSTSTTLKTLTTSTPSMRSSETGSSTTVKMSSSSPLPPPPTASNPPKSSPKPDITTFPVRPQPPRPTPPPAPTPIDPGVCDSTYTTVDVSELTGLDPHFLEKYLGLLGLGGLLDGLLGGLLSGILGSGGLAGNSEKEKLVHQYRVLCDVALPDGPAPSFPDYKGGEEHTKTVQGGHRECLETCERQVINMAGQNLLRECLGVAYRPKAGAAGEEGECRYWCGEHKEHEFLPVDSLPSKSREGKGKGKEKPGRWQVIYM